MSATCDTRWWILMYGRDCGPMVVSTTDEDQGASRRDGPYEVIDRHAEPLPIYVPEVVA
jgi:hypothetical protein